MFPSLLCRCENRQLLGEFFRAQYDGKVAFSTKEELIERIHSVFPNKRFCSAESACPCKCYECQELDAAIREKPWGEYSPGEAFLMHAGTSLFSDDAFRHLLPAYMCAALIDAETADVAVEFTAWAFLTENEKKKPHRSAKGLSGEQREALCDWLEWFILGMKSDLELTSKIEPADKNHAAFLARDQMRQAKIIERYEAEVQRMREEEF